MAARGLDTILTEINGNLNSDLWYSNNDYHTIADLQEDKDGKTWPMPRVSDRQGKKISPLDTKQMQFYHRIIDHKIEPLDIYRGRASFELITYSMILVGVGFRRNMTTSSVNENQDYANEVARSMGNRWKLTQKEIIRIQRIEDNKQNVIDQEFPGHTTFQPKKMELFAFIIEYTIEQRQICRNANYWPVNLLGTQSGLNVALTWVNNNTSLQVEIYRSTTSGSGFTLIDTIDNASGYTDTLTSGGIYYYKIKYITQNNYSNEVSINIPAFAFAGSSTFVNDNTTANYASNATTLTRGASGYIEVWFKVSDVTLVAPVWGGSSVATDSLIQLVSSKLRYQDRGGTAFNLNGVSEISNNTCVHAIVAWKPGATNTDYYLYHNGVEVDSELDIAGDTELKLFFSRNTSGSFSYGDNEIGLFRHGNTFITESQALTLYNEGNGNYGLGTLVVNFENFEQTAGQILDTSGNNYDLDVFGSASETTFSC